MTFRDAYSQIEAELGIFDAGIREEAAYRLLKRATAIFADQTAATVYIATITMDTSRDYSLNNHRIGRLLRVESIVGDEVVSPRGVRMDEFDRYDTNVSNSSGTHPAIYGHIPGLIRIYPRPGSGTLKLYYTPVPIMADRGTPRERTLTATGGATNTVAFTTVAGDMNNIVANRQGANDYYTGCRVVFESGITSNASYVSDANEGATLTTFTLYPFLSSAAAVGHLFRIEDSLEVAEQYAPVCVAYAAGMIAAQKEMGGIAQAQLSYWQEGLQSAKRLGFGEGPDTENRVIDYVEARSRRWYG